MNRFKNYGLWVSIFALVGLVCQTYGVFAKLGLTNDSYNELVKAVLIVLVGAGIISNPNSGTGYTDIKTDTTTDNKTEAITEVIADTTTATTTTEDTK